MDKIIERLNVSIPFLDSLMKNATTAVQEAPLSSESTMLVYPNPVYDEAIIQATFKKATTVMIYLLNTSGQIVKTFLSNKKVVPSEYTYRFPVDDLPPGIYYCVLETSKERKVQKLVLSK